MGYDEHLYIKKKKGQGQDKYIVAEHGGYISEDPAELINNFFQAIHSDLGWNENVWQDTPPEGDKTEYSWEKIDDGVIPIWTSHGPKYAGGLCLDTLEGIKAFLKANNYEDIAAEDIEYISIGWNC